MSKPCLVIVSSKSKQSADKIAEKVIEKKLAACVNIIGNVESVYTWNQSIERATEAILLIKTTRQCFDRLCNYVSEIHEYDCPEIIAIDIVAGHEPYLNWLLKNTPNSEL